MSEPTKSKTSPTGGKRGCLGKDGTYSVENCNGDLQNQGIGAEHQNTNTIIINTNEERIITNNL